jgi:hypothetical protein
MDFYDTWRFRSVAHRQSGVGGPSRIQYGAPATAAALWAPRSLELCTRGVLLADLQITTTRASSIRVGFFEAGPRGAAACFRIRECSVIRNIANEFYNFNINIFVVASV